MNQIMLSQFTSQIKFNNVITLQRCKEKQAAYFCRLPITLKIP